ncbi:hypothetical protein ACOMHN_040852 [Nucella lapillus]
MEHFHPEKELKEKYVNVVITRSADRFVCVFRAEGFSDCKLTVVVENKQTMCSTLVLYAYKSGVKVPFGKILNPNNGLSSYSMFHEAVHFAHNVYELPLSEVLGKVVTVLQAQEVQDSKKAKKLDFLTNHLKLLADKQYTTADYCFARPFLSFHPSRPFSQGTRAPWARGLVPVMARNHESRCLIEAEAIPMVSSLASQTSTTQLYCTWKGEVIELHFPSLVSGTFSTRPH